MSAASGKALGKEYLAKMQDYLARTESLPVSPDGTLNITAIAADAGVPKQSIYKNPSIRDAVEKAKTEKGVASWAERSGRDGANTLQRFNSWVAEREAAADWKDYIHGGKLSRSEIASECGFALSVVSQNQVVREALAALEGRLRASGVIVASGGPQNTAEGGAEDPTSQALEHRILIAKGKAEQRVKALEEQNAALKAEVLDLRDQLGRYKHLDQHLCKTGRLLHS